MVLLMRVTTLLPNRLPKLRVMTSVIHPLMNFLFSYSLYLQILLWKYSSGIRMTWFDSIFSPFRCRFRVRVHSGISTYSSRDRSS